VVNPIDIRISEEQIRVVNNLEGVVYRPDLLPPELWKEERWLKVDLNKDGKWKRPYSHNGAFHGIPSKCGCDQMEFHDWQKHHNQRTLHEVLEQPPKGKAGIALYGSLFAIDADEVIDPKTRTLIEPTVLRVIHYLKTPVYLSQSGVSLHLLCKSDIPNLIVPDKNLAFKVTAGGSGQLLGANYPSFCAFTGFRLDQFPYREIATITPEKWEWLERQLWTHKPTRSISRTVPRTKTAPKRARTARTDDYFGREWKGAKDYLGRLYAWKWDTIRGFRKGNSTDHSLWNQYWLRAYWRYAVNPNVKEAVEFSKAFQRHFDNNAPPWIRLQKSNWHDHGWYQNVCLQAMEHVFLDSPEEEEARTPYGEKATTYLDHFTSTFVSPRAWLILSHAIRYARGRDEVTLSDTELGLMVGVTPKTVREMKKELRQHSCIELPPSKPQKYIFRPDAPCGT